MDGRGVWRLGVDGAKQKRIGVLVVAYNAASTLAKVLDRIPSEIRPDIEEVIVSDDHSQDSTYLVGLGYQQQSDLPITLIRQPTNLGYGGNQKAGYNLAIEHGLDIVVMLHGDGQYAPESLPEILAPLLNEETDAVFGSRTMIKGAARRGGMPLYKFAGNRILSRFENAALGTNLSEFHSGYRAYSVAALTRTPTGSISTLRSLSRCTTPACASPRFPFPRTTATRSVMSTAWVTPPMSPRTSSPTDCKERDSGTEAA
jgi:glycosyltransferase involved in cell wall biosynthesis